MLQAHPTFEFTPTDDDDDCYWSTHHAFPVASLVMPF